MIPPGGSDVSRQDGIADGRVPASARPLVCMFPGQGSQRSAIGRALLEEYPEARACFDEAEQLVSAPLRWLACEATDRELVASPFLQVMIATMSCACWSIVKDAGLPVAAVCGHSLGEYTALVVAGTLPFNVMVRVVACRARIMNAVAARRPGCMLGVVGVPLQTVREVLATCASGASVILAVANAPRYGVVAGPPTAVQSVAAKLRELGATSTELLPTAGAWHHPGMTDALDEFRRILDTVDLCAPAIPFYSSVSGGREYEVAIIRQQLIEQLTAEVLWMRVILSISTDLPNAEYLEVGPGRVLQGLLYANGLRAYWRPPSDDARMRRLLQICR